MDFYQQKRYWIIGVIILIVLNIGSLGLLWQKNGRNLPPRGQHKDGNAFFKRALNLSEQQAIDFDRIRSAHFAKGGTIHQKIRKKKEAFFNEMTSSQADTIKGQALANEIGQLEAEKEMRIFMHLQELMSVCDDEQKQKLGVIFHDFMRPKGPNRGGPPPRGPRR